MPPKKKETTISAFERKRLENIAKNNALLNGIVITADKIVSKPAAPKPRAKLASATPRKREPVKVREQPVRATRQSSRLAGLDADSEFLKRKFEVETEVKLEEDKAKRLRVGGDLILGEIKVEGRKWENGLDGLAGLKGLVRGAQPGVRTFTDDDVEDTKDKGLKELRLRMGALKLYEKWPVNGMFRLGFLSSTCHLDDSVTNTAIRYRYQARATACLLNGLPPDRIETHHFRR